MKNHSSLRTAVGVPLLAISGLLAIPLLGASGGGAIPPTAVTGISPRALAAYQEAGGWCEGLRWELLAGISYVESGHGTTGGASIDPDTGEAHPWIFGPPLDGSPGVRSLPIGQWLDWWGLAGPWQQAVGSMQFLPGTFTSWQVDGDGDGTFNPHDIDDAVPTAANYLCGGRNGRIDDERAALLSYNRSDAYATKVLAYVEGLAFAGAPTGGIVCPVTGPVSFIDSWGAPRSGGRQHEGVDMFASYGTPVVAPVAGTAEQTTNELGGLSFRLWGDDGSFYYGAHLSAFAAATGQVTAGTVLGYVGTSGNARVTSPHLHFEIHPGRTRGTPSNPANPTAAVSAACATNRLGVGISGGS